MAAPPEKTIKDLSGKWVMNKGLSGEFDAILALQGIGYLKRTIIGAATITLNITQYVNEVPEPGTTHIDIQQTVTGGIQATPEFRTLNWTEVEHADKVFGDLKGRSRWTKLDGLGDECKEGDKEFLTEGWEDGTKDEEFVQSFVINDKAKWTAVQVWGFQVIEGKRYYCRNVVVRKGSEVKRARLVYDYYP